MGFDMGKKLSSLGILRLEKVSC